LLGERIRIGGQSFHVIGVMRARGQAEAGANPDAQVLVPLRAARFRLFGADRLNSIYVVARSEQDIPTAMAEIQSVLRRSHRLRPDQPDDFRIRNQADFLTVTQDTAEVFTYLLAGIAAVSLLVGGIGIMNIMLVSVTERTKEIGIRKALGATRRTILHQFLAEAVAICLVGGIVGVLTGQVILIALRHVSA
jgi:putative ABC transport system permease protein